MNDYAKRLGKSLGKQGLKLLLPPKGLLAMCILAIGILIISFLFSVVALISDSDDCSNVAQPDANLPVSTDTKGYAKMIFNHMVQVEGSSGAGAAGVLAIVERESQFNPKAVNPAGGVAGWLQWSGWLHTANGSRITKEGSIKNGDLSTLTPENELKLLHYELSGPYKSAKQAMQEASDPFEAAKKWSVTYEGVALSDGQTKLPQLEAAAKKYYQQFGGESIKGNPGIDGANEGADSGASAGTDEQQACSAGSGGSGAEGYGLPVAGKYTLGTGTYPSYSTGSTSHDHDGVDFQSKGLTEDDVRNGTKKAGALSVHNGTVDVVQKLDDQWIVVIRNSDKRYSYYGHSMVKPPVKKGDMVSRGQIVNYQGYGGDVRPKSLGAAHVHFGMASAGGGQSFLPGSSSILSPADFLPLPKSVMPDGSNGGKNDRVTGSGFTRVFNSKDTDKAGDE